MSNLITVRNDQADHTFQVDEHSAIADYERAEPCFFETPHGKRETYTIHRGGLIVRNTRMELTGYGNKRQPVRQTAVYLLIVSGDDDDTSYPYSFCISVGSDPDSIAQAKRLIDRVLDDGEYHYGI